MRLTDSDFLASFSNYAIYSFHFQMKVTQAQVSQNYSIAHQKNQLLETKLQESQETNSKLDAELQVASLQIVIVKSYSLYLYLVQF